MPRHGWRFLVATAVTLAVAGCTTLADRIADPARLFASPLAGLPALVDASLDAPVQRFRRSDGPGIAWRAFPAADYRLRSTFEADATHWRAAWSVPAGPRAPVPAIGTIVYLHGLGMDGDSMLPWTLALAARGWNGISVDLRNHGRSGRAPAGYGTREADDVVALLSDLDARGELVHPVHVMGVSYGAATAMFAAARADGRIERVVALAPYANARDAVLGLARASRDGVGGLRGRALQSYASDARLDAAIAAAGEQLALPLGDIDVGDALSRIDGCTLVLHGERDGFFAMDDVAAVVARSPRAQLVRAPGQTHVSLATRTDWLAAPIADWVASPDRDGACAPFILPADPAPRLVPGDT